MSVDESSKLYRRLRQFRLESLLRLIGNASRGMLSRYEPYTTIPVRRWNHGLPQEARIGFSAWGLCDFAHLAIQATNDFIGREPSPEDLVFLYNDYLEYENDHSLRHFEGLDPDRFTLKFVIGHSQKQFWYQQPYRIREELNRQVELLETIPERIGLKEDLDAVVCDAVGLTMRELRVVLFALFAQNLQTVDLTAILLKSPLSKYHPALTSANLNTVVSFYAADYRAFRDSRFGSNYFHLKPVVSTSTNRKIVPDAFMLSKKMADGPLWILRDQYLRKGSYEFVNLFGEIFEVYVGDLLRRYVPASDFERVPKPAEGKHADWFLRSPTYRLIIEQKTASAAMMLKTSYPDLELIDDVVKRLSEGVQQLDETEKRHSDPERESIKLLVHYDPYFVSDGVLRSAAVKLVGPELFSTENIFFCDVGEFEWLISVLHESVAEFEAIMRTKVTKQHSPNEGIELAQIIPGETEIGNTYSHVELDHWHGLLPALTKRAQGDKAAT